MRRHIPARLHQSALSIPCAHRGSASGGIGWIRISSCTLPLAYPIGDPKLLTGRQKPMTEIANQQWDRLSAQPMCRIVERFNLVWIEEPPACHGYEGHAAPAASFDTPITTGEMLASAFDHADLIRHRAADYLLPDGPRVGGVTPFLKAAGMTSNAGLVVAPHFAMALHVHPAAAYPTEPWIEHFEWLEPCSTNDWN